MLLTLKSCINIISASKQASKQAGTIGQFGIKERSKIDAC
jgi:hypothetical protein